MNREEVKYVRTQNDQIIVFSRHIVHAKFREFNPKSAGFIIIEDNKCKVWGRSGSLNLEAEGEDSALADEQILGIFKEEEELEEEQG